MHVPHSPRRTLLRQARHRVSFALCALFAFAMTASASPSCRPSDSELACRLRSVLSLLQTAAGILAALLIFAVLAAVRAYRRKPRKITPDDITPDAR